MSGITALVGRKTVVDYSRRPLNPRPARRRRGRGCLRVGQHAGGLSKLFGGTGDRRQIEAATAGWAAAALGGLAGFFQVTGSLAADRRLAASGQRTAAVVTGRLGAAFALALLAASGGLVALAVRAGITDPPRALAVTVLIALIYVAIGVLVGTVIQSEMNGALVITLVWLFDVFFGPALGPGSSPLTRVFPMHFPTLMLTGQASGHAGPLGDVGWSVAWAAGLSTLAVVRLTATIRPIPPPDVTARATAGSAAPTGTLAPIVAALAPAPVSPNVAAFPVVPVTAPRGAVAVARSSSVVRVAAVLRAGMHEYRRNRVLWVLLVSVPAVFIGMAVAVTVDKPGPITLVEGARHFTAMLSERRIHATTMAPISSAFLAGITGLFVITGSADGDRRLAIAGFRPSEVLAGRLGVIGAATVLTTAVSVAVSAAWNPPRQLIVFAGANLLIALTYAMIGVLVGPLTGRIGGLYLLLLLAFVDVGLGQSVMLPSGPPSWGAFLPGRGASWVLVDGAFTPRFDRFGFLMLGLAWLTACTAATAAVFHHRTAPRGHIDDGHRGDALPRSAWRPEPPV